MSDHEAISLLNRNAELEEKAILLESKNQHLQFQLDQLKRMIFGAKSERFVPAVIPGQLSLEIPIEENNAEEKQEVITVETFDRKKKKEKDKKHPLRLAFADHLPREVIVILPEGDLTDCKKIGEEITEELEMIEAKVFVKRFIREKYAKTDGTGVLIGELPNRVIDKGLFGPVLITQILTDKYVDHLPLYRQMARFERAGVKLAKSTLGDTITNVCDLMMPLYECLRHVVLQSDYIQVDETPIKVLDRLTKGKTHRGFYWVYHSPKQKLVLFDYRTGRGREGPEELLKNYKGYLQSDGYSVYEAFAKKPDITLLCCMAHARRKFEQALENDREKAEYVLEHIQLLYDVERDIKKHNLESENILTIRAEISLPILIKIAKWLKDHWNFATPESAIGKAIYYTLSRWNKLCNYIENADLQIDNNLIENSIRPIAIGRKNYLFAGSHKGAERAAMIYSFFGTCKMNNVNPQKWLADVLVKINDTKSSQLHTLLPHNWKDNS